MKKNRKFKRERNQRRAFLKSLAVNLIMKGKIKTTVARAKALRNVAERLVTHVKRHPAAAGELRKTLSKAAAQKLVKDVAPKYKERNGGYTRITKLLPRKGDAAKMAFIEFI